ncbi:nucleotidyltransferase family protein [Yoonia sp. GPGPB17]|uniref:nucleotidyltransferase family protein n=1 Tax=Yoonia sp. GPGPB17 TaxID=3026147 RepID=UPI0030BC32A0
MIPILILAAGQSARMKGRDKLLEDVGGMPLLRKQVLTAQETGHPIFVALPSAADERQRAIADLEASIITIPDATEGMSATMRGAVAALPQAPAFMITLGDLISLETSDFLAVINARAAHSDHLIWRGATADGKPGHPILFDASLRASFANLSGDRGGESIVRPLRSETYLVALPDQRARFDLDTPEDWAAWRASNR